MEGDNPPIFGIPYCNPKGFWTCFSMWVQSRIVAPYKKVGDLV